MEGTWSADRLKSCRERAGLSMEHLGELIGVHVNTIRKWEKGQSCPVSKRLKLLASALGTTVAYLSGEEDCHEHGDDIFSSDVQNIRVSSLRDKGKYARTNFVGYGRALVYEHKGERIEVPTTRRGYEIFEKLIFSRYSDTTKVAG